jgi:hypothetical protein
MENYCRDFQVRVGILQPGYLPWLGFFEQMYKSDVFVLYDDVQYDKQGWRNRNRIKTANGIRWLTVPVIVKSKQHPLVHEVLIENKHNWRKKHFLSIKQNYAKASFYKKYINIFEEAYSKEWKYLVDIDMYFIEKLVVSLGLENKKLVRSSGLHLEADKTGRLIEICKIFKADIFYEGASGRSYINADHFCRNGIRLEYQDYVHPVYKQLYGAFVPYLSIIDLLFNHGPDSLAVLTGRKTVTRPESTVFKNADDV